MYVFVQDRKVFVIACGVCSDVWHKTCLGQQRCFTYSVRGISDLIWRFQGFTGFHGWYACASGLVVARVALTESPWRTERAGGKAGVSLMQVCQKIGCCMAGNREAQAPFTCGTGKPAIHSKETFSLNTLARAGHGPE